MNAMLKSVTHKSIMIALLYPYVVGFRPNAADTSWTEIGFAVGKGSYAEVQRDCHGNTVSVTDIPFDEVSASVDHHMNGSRVGAKAGMVKLRGGPKQLIPSYSYYSYEGHPKRTIWYANPNVGVYWKYFGIDLGTLIVNGEQSGSDALGSLERILPSGNIRIGNLNSWYFTLGIFHNQPLGTGGGWVDLGLGFNLGRPHSNLWVGVGGGPFDGGVLSLKGDIPIRERFLLNLRGQLRTGDATEYGLSIGGKIIF